MHGITRKKAKMGSKEIVLFLMISFHLYHPASLLPLGKNLPPAHFQENDGDKETNEHNTSTHHGGGNGIAHRSNFAASIVGRRGGSGDRPVGSGGEGNGGSSTSPNTAGAAVIPLYAAGATNSHRNHHHGAASCSRSCVGLPALCAMILASLAVHIYVA